jgi:hypothetical protein
MLPYYSVCLVVCQADVNPRSALFASSNAIFPTDTANNV